MSDRTDARETRDVRAGEEIPLEPLNRWLTEAAPEVGRVERIEQFPGGFSNLTYLLVASAGEFVLRRPPRGVSKGPAHDMAREFRILSVLTARGVAVPRPIALGEDATVLGSPFYVMQRVRGLILRTVPPTPPAAEQMRALSESFVRTLVDIHAIGPDDPAIAALGKPIGYVARQIGGWTQRWERSRTDEVPAMDEVVAWLTAHQPADAGSVLVHNDYKYDNLVLDPTDISRIVGVLDWEMATLGDPLLDLGTSMGYWVESGDHPAFRSLGLGVTALPGNFTRCELWARYLELSGRSWADPRFYHAFGLFKIAVIAQQIYARYKLGLTTDARFARLGDAVALLAQTAHRVIEAP